jgi:hypothetical protein
VHANCNALRAIHVSLCGCDVASDATNTYHDDTLCCMEVAHALLYLALVAKCRQRTLGARWPRLHHWPRVESVACEGMAAAEPPRVSNTSSDVEVTPLWAAQQVVHGHQSLGVSGALGSMRACVVDAGAVSYLMVCHANVPTLFG